MYMGVGVEGTGSGVGIPAFQAAEGGGRSSLRPRVPTASSTGLGELCTRRQPLVYSYLMGTGAGGGRTGPALAVLGGGIPKNPGAGMAGGTGLASWPSSASTQTGVGFLSSSCNHFYLILLRVVHGRIYLLSDDALQLWSVYLRRDCILKESITQY